MKAVFLILIIMAIMAGSFFFVFYVLIPSTAMEQNNQLLLGGTVDREGFGQPKCFEPCPINHSQAPEIQDERLSPTYDTRTFGDGMIIPDSDDTLEMGNG